MAELQPQPLSFTDDETGGDGDPLRVVDVRIPDAGNAGQRTFKGRGSKFGSHAERER